MPYRIMEEAAPSRRYKIYPPDDNEPAASMSREEMFERLRQQQARPSHLQQVDDRVRSIARGVPIVGGVMDEASAALNTGFGTVGNYDDELKRQRERDAKFDAEHPGQSYAGQITGGIVGGAAMLPARMFQGASIAPKMFKAAGIGAAVSAADAFGNETGGFERRATNSWKPAVGGSIVGAAAPPVAAATGKLWGSLSNFFTTRGYDKKAVKIVIEQLQAAGLTPTQAWVQMGRLGKQGMLADTAPGMQIATGGAAVADSMAGNTIAARLAARNEGGKARTDADLNAAFGPPRDPYAFAAQQRNATKGTDQAYEIAKNYDIDLSTVADWLTKQVQLYNGKGPIGGTLAGIRDMITDARGNLITNGGQVHATRRQIDHLIDQAKSSGGPVPRELIQARIGIDTALKQGVPGLIEADAAQAASKRSIESFNMGRDALQGGQRTMTPEQVRAEVAKRMAAGNPGEVDAMRQGMRTEIDRVLSNQRVDPSLQTDRILSRDWNREKAEALIGKDRSGALGQAVDREATFRETRRLADPRQGSPTAARQAAAKDIWGANGRAGLIGEVMAAGTAGTALGGPAGGAAATLAVAATSLRDRLIATMARKASPQTIQEAADYLTATGNAREPVIRKLEEYFTRLPVRENTVANVGRLINAAILGAGAPAAGQAVSGRLPGPR